MASRHILALTLAAIAVACSPCGAKVGLESNPQDVDLGRFKVGQVKECTVSIRNITGTDVEVERVMSSCGCVSIKIDRQRIPAGLSAFLRITAQRPHPGPFSYSAIILPRREGQIEPLKITVRGEAVTPVSAQVGWQGGVLQDVIYPNPVALGTGYRSSSGLIVNLIAREELDLRDSVVNVNSSYFRLDEAVPRSAIDPQAEVAARGQCQRLTIMLRPRAPLELGRLQDTLEVNLRDGSKVYIAIVCRIVGDVYLDEEVIRLGELARSPERTLHVLFADQAKRWDTVHCEGTGLLYQGITIHSTCVEQAADVTLTLAIDRVRASRLPKGYLFCRVRLYGDASDEHLTLFVDGFN